MNLIILFKDDFINENTVRLTGRRLEHILTVHHAEIGATLRVGLLNNRLGEGKISILTDSFIEIEVNLLDEPMKPVPLTMILALPRPKSLKKALQVTASMGVKQIYLINSWRVDKSYWKSPVLTEEKLSEQLVLGLEQGKDTILPVIHLKNRFKPFVEDEISTIAAGTCPLLAHPDAKSTCPFNIGKPVTLVVGPEGGFIPYEVELLQTYGFKPVNIGQRILRVEYAIPAILGRLF